MSIRREPIRDSLMFYDLMCEAENIYELNRTIDYLLEEFRNGICDLCEDKGWEVYDLDCEIM